MAKVFLSYSHRDKERAEKLRDDVRALLGSVWMDPRLTGGQDWWDEILAEIRKAELFVFSLSDDSLNSEPCRGELAYALALGKGVIPVRVADVSTLPPELARINYVDHTDGNENAQRDLGAAFLNPPPTAPLPDPLPPPPELPVSPLGRLADRVRNSERLTPEEQKALAFDLETRLGTDDDAEARSVLHQLKERGDTLKPVADKIEKALSEPAPPDRRDPPPVEPKGDSTSKLPIVLAIAVALVMFGFIGTREYMRRSSLGACLEARLSSLKVDAQASRVVIDGASGMTDEMLEVRSHKSGFFRLMAQPKIFEAVSACAAEKGLPDPRLIAAPAFQVVSMRGDPLSSAEVSIREWGACRTDGGGQCVLSERPVKPGARYQVDVSRSGYEPRRKELPAAAFGDAIIKLELKRVLP